MGCKMYQIVFGDGQDFKVREAHPCTDILIKFLNGGPCICYASVVAFMILLF